MFDLAAKRHDYVLAEIQKLANQNIWWIVAGSRGQAPSPWEDDAHRALGSRFVALTDVPFDRMPRIYAATDLFVSASLYETFGLVYLEAQLSGIPAVARGGRQPAAQLDEQFHKRGIQFFAEGKLNDALAFIARSLGVRETAK